MFSLLTKGRVKVKEGSVVPSVRLLALVVVIQVDVLQRSSVRRGRPHLLIALDRSKQRAIQRILLCRLSHLFRRSFVLQQMQDPLDPLVDGKLELCVVGDSRRDGLAKGLEGRINPSFRASVVTLKRGVLEWAEPTVWPWDAVGGRR